MSLIEPVGLIEELVGRLLIGYLELSAMHASMSADRCALENVSVHKRHGMHIKYLNPEGWVGITGKLVSGHLQHSEKQKQKSEREG